MSAFTAALRLQRPEERILKCSALRRRNPRANWKNTSKVSCEKPALHDFGCLVTPGQLGAPGLRDSAVHLIKREAHRHAGRDRAGKWYFWETW